MSEEKELPKYKCHKEVHALKIAAVEFHDDGSAKIAPADEGYEPLMTMPGWHDRFKGGDDDRGYYVIYEDGYTSWSPSNVFEKGYTRIE
jgi:hypothetical protein